MRGLLLAASLLTMTVVGCGDDDDDDATSETATSQPPATNDATSVPAAPAGSDEQQAIADLAARQGVDPSAITTVSVEEVTWRDGSIGCPEPGATYTQALVDGMRVVLEVDGQQFEYHSGGGQAPFLCEDPEPPSGE